MASYRVLDRLSLVGAVGLHGPIAVLAVEVA